jgi:polyisoprenyl-phosphate glycosyltransferase
MSNISLAIVIPVYNDWKSLSLLLPRLDKALSDKSVDISLLVINDASSTDHNLVKESLSEFNAIKQIDIINLNCNLGHQRAIAIGLVEVFRRGSFDAVIVMDADGEDRPEDAGKLLDMYVKGTDEKIIVARRDKRSEGKIFKLGYFVYKLIFRLLTGQTVDFGNFCLIPAKLLNRLVFRDSLWNHLSATILRSKLAIATISTARGTRLYGTAKMNFGELVLLGLSAVSVYIDKTFLRTLFFSMLMCIAAILGIIIVTAIRFFTVLAIPGWASSVAGSLLVILILSLVISIFVLFIILANRSQMSMVPAKYAIDYIDHIQTVFER